MNIVFRITIAKRALIVLPVVLLIIIGVVALRLHHSGYKQYPPQTAQNGNFSGAARSAEVSMGNMLFMPSKITVVNGTTVTWTNNDKTTHTVIADQSSGPHSGGIAPGGSFSYTFNQAGSYQYHSSIQPSMRGTIVVK